MLFLWTTLAALALGASPTRAAERPNVLLIITDDQGYGDFSLHGNPTLQTPRLDALGHESVRFDRFFVNSFCAPTRAALLTGRYPLRCGVWGVTHGKETMRTQEQTLAELLAAAGYRTGCFGKWHNGEQWPYTPPAQGFDEFFGFPNGHWNNYFDSDLLRGAKFEPTKGYITDVLTDEAIRFMSDQVSSKKPFFCYVAYNAPHSPFQAPDKHFDKFKRQGLDDTLAAYYGMCASVDENVGRLLDELDRRKLAENTIVVFLTDNGGTAGVQHFNAGMRGGKTSLHEGGTRVPLFVRWPAERIEPKVVPQIAAHIDIVPTLLDLCGVAPPAEIDFDGQSLRPLLETAAADWPQRTLFAHNPTSETNRYPGAVRTQKYRLVRELGRGPQGGSKAKADRVPIAWQLYDMTQDPAETHDLAKELPEVVADLSKQYEAWYDDISSTGLARLPIQIGHPQENPVTLHAPQAYFAGSNLKFNSGPGYANDWLTGWNDPQGVVWFEIDVVREGTYDLALEYSCPAADAGSEVLVSIGDWRTEVTVPAAEPQNIKLPHRDQAGHAKYQSRQWSKLPIGAVKLEAGRAKLAIQATSIPGNQALDLKGVVLERR
ncbi:MAG: arylsulfatase [Pirellulaceae bacterium]